LKPYRALLLDLDGTVIDSRTDIVLSVQHGFRAVGTEPPLPDAITPIIGKPLKDYPGIMGYQLSPEQNAAYVQAYRDYYAAHMADHTRLYPGAAETLTTLRQQGLKFAVVTTKRQDQAELVVARLGLDRWTDYVRGWIDGRRNKPDPDPILDAIAALGVSPDRTMMVGDSEQDILAAQAAGIDSCACLYGFRDPDYLLSLKPTCAIRAFAELLTIVSPEKQRN
jgi:HAD superfamily hydrolase (TIGR01509 family)